MSHTPTPITLPHTHTHTLTDSLSHTSPLPIPKSRRRRRRAESSYIGGGAAAMSPISPLLVATVLAFFFFFFTLLPAPISAFNRYTIGGKKGWNPGVNYTLWNNHTRYYVGDWLVFLYQPNMADVIQVNKTDYEACSAEHPITNYSKGRSYAFRLNHTGDFYFICSKGYCYQGMKVHFLAEVPPPPSPPPSSSLNLSGARSIVDSLGRNAVQVFGAAAAVAAALLRSI